MRSLSLQPAVALVAFAAASGAPAAELGFTTDFNSGTTEGWGGGSEVYEPLPSGGVGGSDDGYLRVGNETFPGFLGVRSLEPEYTGNLLADGVTGFSFWLRDVGPNDNTEIHVGVGTALINFWIYTIGFQPPDDGWTEYTVDITSSANWVRIHGSGTFANALQNSDRLLFRHDVAPFGPNPPAIQADFGIDRIKVLPEPGGLGLLALGGLLTFRRLGRGA